MYSTSKIHRKYYNWILNDIHIYNFEISFRCVPYSTRRSAEPFRAEGVSWNGRAVLPSSPPPYAWDMLPSDSGFVLQKVQAGLYKSRIQIHLIRYSRTWDSAHLALRVCKFLPEVASPLTDELLLLCMNYNTS